MTRGDGIIVAAVIALAVCSFPLAVAASEPGSGVLLRGPRGGSTLDAGVSRSVVVEGRRGDVRIQVQDGRARVTAADCPDQVCVRTGWSAPGKPVVCAPNGVVVESGAGGGALDAISR